MSRSTSHSGSCDACFHDITILPSCSHSDNESEHSNKESDAPLAVPKHEFDSAINGIYGVLSDLGTRLDQLTSVVECLSVATTPIPSAPTSKPSTAYTRAKPRRQWKSAAPANTPITGCAHHSQTINAITLNKAAQEKITTTLSIPDSQAGHVVGHMGTGLHQISDRSHVKVLLSPTVNSSSCAITIWGTNQELGDVISAIGKRLVCHCLCTPRSQKKEAEGHSYQFHCCPPSYCLCQACLYSYSNKHLYSTYEIPTA